MHKIGHNLDLKSISIDSKEMVYDMSYDWFGKRLAVVTAERKIKIYLLNEAGEWKKSSEFMGHDGPIWKIKWAHPDFGTIIATCKNPKKPQKKFEKLRKNEKF